MILDLRQQKAEMVADSKAGKKKNYNGQKDFRIHQRKFYVSETTENSRRNGKTIHHNGQLQEGSLKGRDQEAEKKPTHQ